MNATADSAPSSEVERDADPAAPAAAAEPPRRADAGSADAPEPARTEGEGPRGDRGRRRGRRDRRRGEGGDVAAPRGPAPTLPPSFEGPLPLHLYTGRA